MARQRSRQGTTEPPVAAVVAEVANNGTNNKERKLMALTDEQIAALLANTRTKGGYSVKLVEFLDGGDAGIAVAENWPELKDKKDSTVAQGFENAKKNKDAPAAAEFVKVIKNDGQVFLINLKAETVEVAA